MPLRPISALAMLVAVGVVLVAPPQNLTAAEGPSLIGGGPLAFGPDGVLFIADNAGAKIVALELGDTAAGATPGTGDIEGIDRYIAARLGTDASEIRIHDLAISPTSRNAFISVSRGRGTGATPVLLRVDGASAVEVIKLNQLSFTELSLPNVPAANPAARRNPHALSVTDMAYVDGQLFIAGLSNEEFASTLRSVNYPFTTANVGTSVEIWHAAHGRYETHSPVYTFIPYELDGEQNLIAGYLCTPLVKFAVSDLEPGAKTTGTTIAELGNRNRPIDMVVYEKDGQDYLLMSNTSRGVMKIPTAGFGGQPGLTEPVPGGGTAGVTFETVDGLTGVEQLGLLDDTRALVIARDDAGRADLTAVHLP